ncbi:MAG: sigma factor-like helix-turn-helix DNA-binding protein [Chloroflexota bacterium]|nr:sigma factor-like helix-turn-helix DNA-binding protein [Chloroflexota bacterium]
MPERQRRVLSLRYGLQDGTSLSLRQAGKRLGTTGERVRLIERDAIVRLWRDRELTRWAIQPLLDALAEAGGIARAEQVIEGVRRSATFQLPPTEGGDEVPAQAGPAGGEGEDRPWGGVGAEGPPGG